MNKVNWPALLAKGIGVIGFLVTLAILYGWVAFLLGCGAATATMAFLGEIPE